MDIDLTYLLVVKSFHFGGMEKKYFTSSLEYIEKEKLFPACREGGRGASTEFQLLENSGKRKKTLSDGHPPLSESQP
jgi:hypothetical protein